MNPPCSIETGLFKKKPCGQLSVTKCTNCEQPLCKDHAVAQKKAGVFMCKDCNAAGVQFEKNQADVAKAEKEKRDAEMIKSMMNPSAPKPKVNYAQQAGSAAPAAPAAKPAAGAAKPAAGAPAAPAPAADAPLEFTPSKPKPPADDGALEFTPTEKPKK